jgi:hypothetical protein
VVTAKRNPGAWDHTVSRLRQDRKTAAAHAGAVKRLTDAGVTVIDRPVRGEGPVALDNLVDGDGNVLDAASHAACPGHAAAISEYRPEDISYYCVDPTANGHQGRYAGAVTIPTVVGGKMTEEAKAARREVIEGNKAWRAAEPVRRQWVEDLLARKTPPKGTLRFAVGEVLADPDRIGDGKDAMLAELLRKPEPRAWGRSVGAAAATEASEARLPLVLLAQIAAAREQTMSEATWRTANGSAARWFVFLASTGYTLADIEQRVVNDARDATTSPMPTDRDDHRGRQRRPRPGRRRGRVRPRGVTFQETRSAPGATSSAPSPASTAPATASPMSPGGPGATPPQFTPAPSEPSTAPVRSHSASARPPSSSPPGPAPEPRPAAWAADRVVGATRPGR